MFEGARPGHRILPRGLADQQCGQVMALGPLGDDLRDLVHLRDPAGAGIDGAGGDGLHGVHDQQGGPDLSDVREYLFEFGLVGDEQVGVQRADPSCPQPDLFG